MMYHGQTYALDCVSQSDSNMAGGTMLPASVPGESKIDFPS